MSTPTPLDFSREECDPLPNNICTRNTPNPLYLEECDARRIERLQAEHDTSRRTRVIPVVVDRSKIRIFIVYVAFGAVEVFLIILSVLGLHVNLVMTQNRFLARAYYANNV